MPGPACCAVVAGTQSMLAAAPAQHLAEKQLHLVLGQRLLCKALRSSRLPAKATLVSLRGMAAQTLTGTGGVAGAGIGACVTAAQTGAQDGALAGCSCVATAGRTGECDTHASDCGMMAGAGNTGRGPGHAWHGLRCAWRRRDTMACNDMRRVRRRRHGAVTRRGARCAGRARRRGTGRQGGQGARRRHTGRCACCTFLGHSKQLPCSQAHRHAHTAHSHTSFSPQFGPELHSVGADVHGEAAGLQHVCIPSTDHVLGNAAHACDLRTAHQAKR